MMRFIASIGDTRKALEKSRLIEAYRKWAEVVEDEQKDMVQDDLYQLSRLCPLRRYIYTIAHVKSIRQAENEDGVRFVSTVRHKDGIDTHTKNLHHIG